MNYFRISNYEKFQHYKDRSPPWIKLYNDILDDYEFSCLQDASKLHLILIYLLASRSDNKIPWDEEWIKKKIGTECVNLDELEGVGFIEKIQGKQKAKKKQNASKKIPSSKQNDCLEGEGETEGETTPKRAARIPDDFALTENRKSLAEKYWQERTRADLCERTQDIFDQFTNDALSKGKKFEDWDRAWTTWYTNAVKFERVANGTNRPGQSGGQHGLSKSERRDAQARAYMSGQP